MNEQKLIDIMSTKNYDLIVLTTRLNEVINGITIAWAMQTSIKPPLMTVALSPKRFSYNLVVESNIFALNYISKDRKDIIELFGYKSGRQVDKFENIEYFESQTGSPILKDAAAYLDCKVVDIYHSGDHDLFVGEVVEADYKSLDWFQSRDFKKKAA